MASNYWDSTQAKFWTFTRDELAERRSELVRLNASMHSKYEMPERRIVDIYLQQRVCNIREITIICADHGRRNDQARSPHES